MPPSIPNPYYELDIKLYAVALLYLHLLMHDYVHAMLMCKRNILSNGYTVCKCFVKHSYPLYHVQSLHVWKYLSVLSQCLTLVFSLPHTMHYVQPPSYIVNIQFMSMLYENGFLTVPTPLHPPLYNRNLTSV